jgi:type I restriction enzyme M protein
MSPFDKARYERLLEGLEATEVLLSEVAHDNDVLRCDAEYFARDVLAAIHRLESLKAEPLEQLAVITDGIHTSLPFVDDGEVKVLSAKHPKDNFIAGGPFETVSVSFHGKNPRTALRKDDVLISTVGTIGNAAVVTPDILPANSDRHIGIIRVNRDGPSPFLLSTFLVCRYGRIQSIRETTGNVQPNLFISKIGRLLIPRFSPAFEQQVSAQVELAYGLRKQSVERLTKAEHILLRALGLDTWTPPEALSYERSSGDAFAAGRLDAEHFQPRFAALATMMAAKGNCERLGDQLLFIARGKQPEYADAGLPVINSKHVLRNEVRYDDANRRAVFDDDSVLIQSGDVLINGTGVGTIGRSAAYLHGAKALPDNHVTILRPTGALDPVYLAVFLNSLAGQLQVDQRLRGSSGQIELYPTDIAEFQVWVAPKTLQLDIRKLVEQCFAERQRASRLLDAAKRAVEIAIEDSEAAALAYLAAANPPDAAA